MARSVRLQLVPLEARAVPDANAVLSASVLAIAGGPGRDRIDVLLDPANAQLIVRDAGREVGRFASAGVSAISIAAGDGNDIVRVASNVTQPVTIDGGAGNDVLRAGGGPAVLG